MRLDTWSLSIEFLLVAKAKFKQSLLHVILERKHTRDIDESKRNLWIQMFRYYKVVKTYPAYVLPFSPFKAL